MAGFFKIPHDLYRGLSRDPNTFRVYCELASRARWTAGTCLGSHGVVELSAGQCVLGRAGLARDLGLTERAVRTSLERLSAVHAVTIESTKRGTIVTVHEDWESAESRPTERPSVAPQNDQAPAPQTANRTTTNEEERKKTEDTHPPARAIPPSAEYDPDSAQDRMQLARSTYERIADARDTLIAEFGLKHEVAMPRGTFAAEPGGFRDLRDRIRGEGHVAPDACDRVVENLIRQAREERSVEWLSDKAFTEGGWRTARNGGSKRVRPRRTDGAAIGAASPRNDHPDSPTLKSFSEL